MDPAGKRLKIPVWMLLPNSADIKMNEQAHLSREALVNLVSLITRPTAAEIHDNLLQTSVDGCKGDHRDTANTSEPDPNRRGTRTGRPDGKSRTGQSHGPHSGDGISNRDKEDR